MTLSQIARAAGVSVATVSYALRNHPKIPAATRAHVQAVAERLGYQPDPAVARLLASIRRGRPRPAGERMAFVWVRTAREEVPRNRFLQRVFAGARDRAGLHGYGLEEFWTADPGMTDRRLHGILRARGIRGVLLSPVMAAETRVTLDWDWSQLAAAVIGNVTWEPELHHAGPHHFLGMRTCLLELRKLGCHRPAAILDAATDARAKHAFAGAFAVHHPTPSRARNFLRLHPATTAGPNDDHTKWLDRQRADALIVSGTELLPHVGGPWASGNANGPVLTLRWENEAPGIGGVDPCPDRIAAHAVDLVASQLTLNETGVPDFPRITLFPGRWVPPGGQTP